MRPRSDVRGHDDRLRRSGVQADHVRVFDPADRRAELVRQARRRRPVARRHAHLLEAPGQQPQVRARLHPGPDDRQHARTGARAQPDRERRARGGAHRRDPLAVHQRQREPGRRVEHAQHRRMRRVAPGEEPDELDHDVPAGPPPGHRQHPSAVAIDRLARRRVDRPRRQRAEAAGDRLDQRIGRQQALDLAARQDEHEGGRLVGATDSPRTVDDSVRGDSVLHVPSRAGADDA